MSILRSIFESTETDKGEAAREFLLAIASERLVLCNVDLASLYAEFSVECSDPVASAFWSVIKNRHLQ